MAHVSKWRNSEINLAERVSVAGKRVARRIPWPQWLICIRDKYPA